MPRGRFSRRETIAAGAAGFGIGIAGCADLLNGDDGLVRFESGVGDDLRERVEDVYDRTVAACGRELREPVSLEVVGEREMRDRAAERAWLGEAQFPRRAFRIVGILEEVDDDPSPGFAGTYDPAEERIVLVDFGGSELSDLLVAHELLHAIQFQTVDDLAWWRWDWPEIGIDKRRAVAGTVEGAATFLETELQTACERGEHDTCLLGREWRADQALGIGDPDGVTLVTLGAHANGLEFAKHLAEGGVWAGLWDAHETPPTHSAQILKPDRYPDAEPAPVEIDASPEDWDSIGSTRVGMLVTFATLWHHDAIPADTIYTRENGGSAADHVAMRLVRYRSTVTDAWRGDRLTLYEREDGDYGGVWRLRWATTTGAEAATDALETWADGRGDRIGDDPLWRLSDDRYLSVRLRDRETDVIDVPDPTAVDRFASPE